MSTQDPIIRILVVDDDPVFTTLAQAVLGAAGFDTLLASDGASALEALDRELVDIALIDLVMPRVDGLRLIAHIRADRRHSNLPIVVATSDRNGRELERAQKLGISALHKKPVVWPELVAELRDILTRAAAT